MFLFVDNFLQLCLDTNFFEHLIQASLVLAIISAVFATIFTIPYGKSYRIGSAKLKIEIPDRIAFMLAHFFGFFIFICSQLYYPNGDIFSIPSCLYILHYIHRIFIYPWFRKSISKKWPLESLLFYFFSNFQIGLLISHMLIFDGKSLNIFLQIFLAILFIACACVAGFHDYYLCSLKQAGRDQFGYQIPQGFFYKWISGPNYAFEMLQWITYLPFLSWGFDFVVCGLWLLTNLASRAESNHESYKKIFKTKYPEERTPYIPFVKDSKILF